MHCSVRKWGTNSRVHSISGGDHQNIVDGTDRYEASMLKILLNMLVGAQFSFAWVLWRNINLEKWILWVHCKIANIFRIKLQSFPCARFVLNRAEVCVGEKCWEISMYCRNLFPLSDFSKLCKSVFIFHVLIKMCSSVTEVINEHQKFN